MAYQRLRLYSALTDALLTQGEKHRSRRKIIAAICVPGHNSEHLCPRTQFFRTVCANVRAVTEGHSTEELQRLLSLVNFMGPLSADALSELARRVRCTSIQAGEDFIVGPEEHGEWMLLLVRGQVQVCEIDTSGRELTLAVPEYGLPIGATGLAPRQLREVRVRALEPSLICRLHRQDLEETVRKEPEVGLRLAQLLGRRLVWMEARWADLASKEVSARLASMLLRLLQSEGVVTPEGYKIPTRYTHQQLATMIGANREAVTRALGRLREEGAVRLKNRYIYVTDMEALERASS